jgi:hypothetical protein
MGQMLNMTAEQVCSSRRYDSGIFHLLASNRGTYCAAWVQAKMAITKNCEAVVQHAMARRLRFIPIEVLPREEALSRYVLYEAWRGSTEPAISDALL